MLACDLLARAEKLGLVRLGADDLCSNVMSETVVAQTVSATPEGGYFAMMFDEIHAGRRVSNFMIGALLADIAIGR